MLFLDGNKNGMVSTVAKNIPCEYMSFKHLGEVKNGVENTASEQVKVWAGAHENYTLTANDNRTRLTVDMETHGLTEDFRAYFLRTWPIALQKLKDIAEAIP